MLSMRSHAPGVSINSTADWAEPCSMYRWTRVVKRVFAKYAFFPCVNRGVVTAFQSMVRDGSRNSSRERSITVIINLIYQHFRTR